MKKQFLLIILAVFLFSSLANASPQVSFTSASHNGKVALTPTINSDVTHYKWEIELKGGGHDSETGWIAYADAGKHIVYLDTGHYFVTITGKDSENNQISFTNRVISSIKEDYVRPEEVEIEEAEISKILNSLPEPFRSFMLKRNETELSAMIISIFVVLFVISRRKKEKKYFLVRKMQ